MPRPPSAPRLLAVCAVAIAAAVAGCDFGQASLADEGPRRPAKLTFSVQPEYAQAGQPIGPVSVTVLDSQGDTDYSSTPTVRLSIQLGTGVTAASLNGTTQVAAVDGTALFTDLSIDSAGAGYRLLAVADGLGSALSDSFTVTSAVGAPVTRSPARGLRAIFLHPPS